MSKPANMRHIHAAGRMMRGLRQPAYRVDTSAAFPRLPKLAGSNRDAFYTARAASSSTSTASGSEEATAGADRATTSTRLSQAEVEARLQQLRELVQEIVKTVISTGPRGFTRGIQATSGVLELAGEYLQRGSYDEPEVFMRKLFEKLGATYIKLGQFIASSPSLFPESFVLEFQKCLDRTEPVPFEKVRAVVQAELGTPIDEVFSFFDPQPLASASIAQVHAAVLRRSNKEVVVKVLKPDVEDVLTTDLNFLYLASRTLEVISPQFTRLSLSAIVGDIRASMMDEVDFMKEARNIREFSKYLDATGMRSFATCPEVYPSSSGKRVLVMERLVGVPLTDLDAIRSVTNADPELTLINALNTWFGSVLACETFHADVHAGNLLVLQDGRVGFIDFGIVGRISPITWKALEALMQGTATEDYRMIAAALATMGATEEDVDVDAFAEDLRQLFKEIQELDSQLVVAADATSGTTSVSANVVVDETQVNRLVIRLAQVSEKNGVRIPREFGLLMKQLLYFDRYTRILAPQLSVLTDSRIQFGSLARNAEGSASPIDFRSQGPSGRSIRVSGA